LAYDQDDCKRFKACLPDASFQESLLAGMRPDPAAPKAPEEPQDEARTPMDAELKRAFERVNQLAPAGDSSKGGADAAADMHPSLVKFWHQRCAYDQLVVDALLATLHNSLRILCCCGEQGLAHIEKRFTKSAGSAFSTAVPTASTDLMLAPGATLPMVTPGSSAYGAVRPVRGPEAGLGVLGRPVGLGGMGGLGGGLMKAGLGAAPQRVVKCNLMTLRMAIDVAGSLLHFLLQVSARLMPSYLPLCVA
jgi:hypothetical protein